MEQMITTLSPLVFAQGQSLENRQDVLFHRHLAENRFFLRQISHPEPRPFVHREGGHVLVAKNDAPAIGPNQANDHVKCRGLAGTIGPE